MLYLFSINLKNSDLDFLFTHLVPVKGGSPGRLDLLEPILVLGSRCERSMAGGRSKHLVIFEHFFVVLLLQNISNHLSEWSVAGWRSQHLGVAKCSNLHCFDVFFWYKIFKFAPCCCLVVFSISDHY